MAVCSNLGVASQGVSEADAKASLQEALELWFESCLERGVLEQALREGNFRPQPAEAIAPDSEHVTVRRTRRRSEDVLGADFSIHLTIPAYQAAALSAAR